MSELEIPERAKDAAVTALASALADKRTGGIECVAVGIIRASLPIALAAELRRLAETWGYADGCWPDAAEALRKHADELDLPGATS